MLTRRMFRLFTVCTALLCGSAHACGEGGFNTGNGLPFQGYLAPRPATVLVYEQADDIRAPDAALAQAGHRVTVVESEAALRKALATQHYDVVIAAFAALPLVEASVDGVQRRPVLLPVVAREQRNAPAVQAWSGRFVLVGASLGQFLRGIDKSLVAAVRQ